MNQTTPLRLIKRYGNRKLYDTSESRYITLDEIARLVRSGNDVKVIDNENGDDLTAITFAQIILEEEKRRSSLISLGLLRELVQHGEETLAQLRTRVEKGVEAAGRRVQEMVTGTVANEHENSAASPEVDSEAGKGFFDEILAAPQRRLEALQRSIDERIKSSVGRITSHPVVQHEVQRIERSIKKLEERLARLRREESNSSRGGNALG
jgi:polyhydroxyalkanoate synthesis repressor PhaR